MLTPNSLLRLTNLSPSGSRSNWNLKMLVFGREGKTGVPGEKTSRSKDENQQQTQPTYDAEFGNQIRATMVGGECSHHWAIRSTFIVLSWLLQEVSCINICTFEKQILGEPGTFSRAGTKQKSGENWRDRFWTRLWRAFLKTPENWCKIRVIDIPIYFKPNYTMFRASFLAQAFKIYTSFQTWSLPCLRQSKKLVKRTLW